MLEVKERVRQEYQKRLRAGEKSRGLLSRIAQDFDLSPSTVRSWKMREGDWDDISGSLQNNVATDQTQTVATEMESVATKQMPESLPSESIAYVEPDIPESLELTDKQRVFVQEYLVDFNATQAAVRAGYSENTAGQIAYENLKKPYIQLAIQKALMARSEKTRVYQDWVLEQYIKIASADIKDFLSFRTELSIVTYTDEGQPVIDYRPVIEMKDSDQVDGSLISQVSISPKGVFTFKLYDKLKALDKLADHVGIGGAIAREKIDLEKEKIQLKQKEIEMKLREGDDKRDIIVEFDISRPDWSKQKQQIQEGDDDES